MVSVHSSKKKKRKDREATKPWMNTPISFPSIMTDDASDEPLIIEAEVEGYLVKAGLRETRTDLVGFAGEVSKPLGKIELEVCFGNEGLSRRTSMKFIIIRAPSLTNNTGRPGLKENAQEEGGVDVTEQIIVNPSFPDQMVTIGGKLSRGCKEQLKTLLKSNMEVFAWELPDWSGVPRKDCKVEAVMGLHGKVFLDAYKGYHQIKWQSEDEEKTAFYTVQGTLLLYKDAGFGLQNAGPLIKAGRLGPFQARLGKELGA
ncbi:hypothetical protein Tco_0659409 [Tanacetum coccineum]